jgi:oxygen-independent coproporphyrinogen-3 oxidase
MNGIYIHLPFCKSKCSYCDFYSVVLPQPPVGATVEAMLREMELRRHFFGEADGETTVYFGGGTPSLLPLDLLGRLAQKVVHLFCPLPPVEFTIEVNPDDATPQYLRGLRELGADRLSVGVQSFFDDDLRLLNRRHSSLQAKRCVELAQQAGFRNISVDLIYGLPHSDLARWRSNVEAALSLGIQHLSAYALTVEERTPFGVLRRKNQLPLPPEDVVVAQHDLLCELTERRGFVHYEISSFAPAGYEARHNTAYWQQQPYLGIGAAAHSYSGVQRQANVPNIAVYRQAIRDGAPFFELENLTEADLYNEYILTGLRTIWGIDLDVVQRRFSPPIYEHCLAAFRKHLALHNVLQLASRRLSIPHSRWMVSDGVVVDFIWDKG